MSKKYCESCGTKLIKVTIEQYNEETGKQKTQLVCPNVGCCNNDWCPVTKSLRHIYAFWSCRCKCGHIMPYASY